MPLPKDYQQGTEFTDLRGNTIKPGDTVVYAALSGRSCQLVEATVLDVAVKDRTVNCRDGYWDWDSVKYDRMFDDPDRTYVTTRTWTEIEQDYKLQLKGTGRCGRWEQHSTSEMKWDPFLKEYVKYDVAIKPVWVMAPQAVALS